jgi:hypothetical protein
MKSNIFKLKEIILIFIIGLIIPIYDTLNSCGINLKLANFDLQTLVAWDYSAIKGILPYKDIFYPYGLLSYYKNENVFLLALNILVFPILLVLIYLMFKKIFNSTWLVNLCMLSFFIFIVTLTGLDSFSRYGVAVIVTIYFAYSFYKDSDRNRYFAILAGAICSIIFTLWIDQGVYVVSAFVFLLLINFLLKKKYMVSKNIQNLIKELILFIGGLIIGAIPLVIYLLKFGMLVDSIKAFLHLSEMPLLAKTPFFLNLTSPDNVFTVLILILVIYYLLRSLLFKSNKITLTNYLLIGLVFDLLFFEQKGLIRSISDQITFVPFLILMVIVYDLSAKIKLSRINKMFIYCVILILPIAYLNIQNIHSFKVPNINVANLNYETCFSRNFSSLINVNNSYNKVVNTISSYKDFNGKIFSFPGDPIFYILFKQRIPYFTSIYEASSLSDQKVLIQFLDTNNIKYVIVNMDNKAIQDTVPNYIRGSYELSYLLNNFTPKTKIGSFLILERNPHQDWFKSDQLTQDFRNYLLDIDLEKIPQSEGRYKIKYLNSVNTNILIKTENINSLNNYLKNGSTVSRNLILILMPSVNTKKTLGSQLIITSGNLLTTVKFTTCTNSNLCLLDISKVPLFYSNRKIDSIRLDNNYQIELFYGSDQLFNVLW